MSFRGQSRGVLPVAALLLIACGCHNSSSSPPPTTLPAGSTYLLHLPGIAGDSPFDHWWIEALKDGGAADRVELYDWTCHDPWIAALQAHDRNHREAHKIADLIASRRRADPTGRIVLTGESGGTGLAIWALEDLPQGIEVNEVVLVAPAISPDYDLTAALRHVRQNVYYFDSAGDVFMLGFGTQLFGTIDGKRTQAAGLVGFHPPFRADTNEYRKLIEIKHDPGWWIWGNFGGHSGAMSSTFAKEFVAPLLVRAEHDEQPPVRQAGESARLPQSNDQ